MYSSNLAAALRSQTEYITFPFPFSPTLSSGVSSRSRLGIWFPSVGRAAQLGERNGKQRAQQRQPPLADILGPEVAAFTEVLTVT